MERAVHIRVVDVEDVTVAAVVLGVTVVEEIVHLSAPTIVCPEDVCHRIVPKVVIIIVVGLYVACVEEDVFRLRVAARVMVLVKHAKVVLDATDVLVRVQRIVLEVVAIVLERVLAVVLVPPIQE